MNKKVLLVLLAGLTPIVGMAKVGFNCEVSPVSVLVSPDLDGFQITKTSGSYTYYETLEAGASWTPAVHVGVDFDLEPCVIDVNANVAGLVNGAFYGASFGIDGACLFKLGDKFAIGPHAGISSYTDATWVGAEYSDEGDVKIFGNSGYQVGVKLIAGKKVYFVMSLDYVSTTYDVETRNGWSVTGGSDEIDMSGLMLQLGVRF